MTQVRRHRLHADQIGVWWLKSCLVNRFNFAFEENANFPSPSPEISFGILNGPCCYKRQSSHLFKKSAYVMSWHKNGILAGSPRPPSISKKPGAIDRCFLLRFPEARNSTEHKIHQLLSTEQGAKKVKNDWGAKIWVPAQA